MLGVALALASPVASARQGAAPVRKAVEDLLLVEMKGLPGEASYTIDSIDENNNLAVSPAPLGRGEPLLAGIDLPGMGFRVSEHAMTENAMHVVLAR